MEIRDSSIKLSVIIPVYNGEKFIKRAVQCLLKQTLKEIEIILVENNSKDNSKRICNELQLIDERIKSFSTELKGTSLARKLGVEKSKGQFITFMDQDDTYVNKYALSNMYSAIIEDNTQICSFGNYKEYAFGLRRKIVRTNNNLILYRDELYKNEIKGILGVHGSIFDTPVWNKIYDGNLLRDAVKNITVSLYFAEDQNLNICAFFNKNLKSVSIRNEAYYVWKVGVGFSSSTNSNDALFKDYQYVKPLAYKMMNKYCKNEEAIFNCYLEAMYFKKATITKMIEENFSEIEIKNKISEWSKSPFVIESKHYFNSVDGSKIWKELKFLISDYSEDEYYEYCLNHKSRKNLKYFVKNIFNLFK